MKNAKSKALKKETAGKMSKKLTDAEKYDKSFREGRIPPHAKGSSKVLRELQQ